MGTVHPAVRIASWKGIPSVTLAAGDLDATFLPSIGLLGVSLRYRGREFLALPGGVRRYRTGHQTGLPLLAPWANRLGSWRYRVAGVQVNLKRISLPTDDQGLPIHGTMTAAKGWEVERLEATSQGAALRCRFDYGAYPSLARAFPFPHALNIDAVVTQKELTVTTSVAPTGRRSLPVSFGFHPFFRLPGSKRSAWRLRLPKREHMELDDRQLPTGRSEVNDAEEGGIGKRTFDDLYRLRADRRMSIEGGGHRLTVEFRSGYPFAQVWVPPGKDFVCFEPMTAPGNALLQGGYRVVRPGEVFAARFSIFIQPTTRT